MINPIELKHDLTSIPLKWMYEKTKESGRVPTDSDAIAFTIVGMYTAAANLMPALGLIHWGQTPPMLFTHTTFKRFNPWLEPIFHYSRELSKAERIGAAAGGRVGKFVQADIWPVFGKTRKAWGKAGTKAGAKLGARIGGRLIPGVGWALLAYDVYDIAYNRSLWGFDFS